MKDWRLAVFRAIVFGVIGGLALFLFNVQVLHGKYYRTLSEKNRIRLIRMEAMRGAIRDRNGVALAESRPSLDIFIVPEDFNAKYTRFLSRTLQMPEKEIVSRLNHLEDAPFVPVLLKRDVTRETVFKIEEKKPSLTGVYAEVQGLRSYPQGPIAAHLIGYLGKITRDEFLKQEEQLYGMNDWLGRSGVEKIFDRYLKGEDGGRQVEVNVRGRQVRVLSEKEPFTGSDLTLTIDSRLQSRIYDILGEKRGTVCLISLEDGGILSLVNKPSFDPNVFVSPSLSQDRVRLMTDRVDMPMLNRAVTAGFPPGSVFKLVTAVAALESGRITPSTTFTCNGSYRLGPHSRPYKCWNDSGHGAVNLYQALERSCNVFFYQAGQRAGVRNLARYAREFGLGQMVDLEITNNFEGVIPDEEWKRKRFNDAWYDGETLNFAIGQGYVLTTPLQITRLAGLLATDGDLPELHLVKTDTPPVHKRRLTVRPETLKQVKQAMLRVVQSDKGTGHLARVDFLSIAAKTGTAQVPPKEPHSWFSGYFPADRPKYAMTVFIEHGGSGGYKAAPVAKEVILSMKELGYFPEFDEAAEAPQPGVSPKLTETKADVQPGVSPRPAL